MRKNILRCLLVIVFFISYSCTNWHKKAVRVIKEECDCFTAANISLNKNVTNLLENSQPLRPPFPRLDGIDTLTPSEKEELKRFAANVYDTTGKLGDCLSKILKEEENSLNNYQTGKLYHEKRLIVDESKECKWTYYYETGAIEAAWYLTREKATTK